MPTRGPVPEARRAGCRSSAIGLESTVDRETGAATDVTQTPFTIGIIQDHADAERAANLARAERLVRDAAARGAQIICLKELFNALVLLQVAAVRALRPGRADPGPDDRRDAGAGARARGRAHRADLRAAGGRRLPQLGGGHRRRRQPCSASIARCTFPTIRCSTRSTTSRRATGTWTTTASSRAKPTASRSGRRATPPSAC